MWHALEDLRKERGSSKLPSLLSRLVPARLLSNDLNAIFFKREAFPAVILFNVSSVHGADPVLDGEAIAFLLFSPGSVCGLALCIY